MMFTHPFQVQPNRGKEGREGGGKRAESLRGHARQRQGQPREEIGTASNDDDDDDDRHQVGGGGGGGALNL